ncbi:S9 family peptidase [Paludibacter sp. 221]|uniref:S9 family peptidase n=1 Tax=Paludibacter sp. 221 TaxID=2302939 RepID=UPI0013D6DE40|nr:S9 family peptidase [Paludibacter sp. 221]NDV47170.1 S9 family peptidase [Paludibacter sp. 221]
MKTLLKTSIMALAVLAASCGDAKKEEATIIGKHDIKIENGLMTPEVLWSFGRIGGVNVSPDGKKIVYTVSYYSVPENKSNSEIFVMNADGSDKKQITRTPYREAAPKWMNDNEYIAFLSNESGSMQLWKMKADGSGRKQLTDREGGLSDYAFSPDESKLLFVADVKYGERVVDKYPDLPKANARIVDDLMYRHWDEWVETVPHPLYADFDGDKISNERDILEGEPYESPMKPFGGIEQLAWSPDGKTIAYTCRKKTGLEYALTTNSDIYFYSLETGKTENKTEGMMGYDVNPVFSPDGKWLAWESMERDGYESDKNRLFLMNIATGAKKDLSKDFPESVHSLAWTADSKSVYFTSCVKALTQIYRADIETAKVTKVTEGVHDYLSVIPAGERLIATRQSMSKPSEIYSVNPVSGEATEISFENKDILAQLQMGKVEERWVKTTDGKQMLTWVVYPPNFDPSKEYPALLYCQGGPQNTISQFWSYRWNIQLMAANDYIIVLPNRRGVPGFGMEWLEQISGDYGGQNMKDYLSAIDDVAKESYVDSDRLGCVGASYGGFSVYWLAGHHDKRFKAFIAHNGMFNFHQKYLTTEELFFANWDLGGPFWDKDNKKAQKSYTYSPHLYVDKWDTPILVIVGEKDFRVPSLQGMAAFNAAVIRGIPAEMLVFPDENHWVTRPQNAILWQRTFFGWLDKWLK